MNGVSRRRGGRPRWWARFRDSVRSSIWPVPTAAIVLSVLLGIALTRLDDAIDSDLPGSAAAFLFEGGAEAARSVLSAIAGSLITATSLTFSLTVVALQLASSQASPRLLRLFAGDRMVHATMAIFLGTFAYTLTVLRTVRAEDEKGDGFVPRVAVTLASVLTLISVVMLALFLAHLARELRVETMLKAISEETRRALQRYQGEEGEAQALPAIERPSRAFRVTAERSGFVVSVDRDDLVSLARRFDLIIAEEGAAGSNIIEGSPLAYWWPRGGSDPGAQELDSIAESIRSAVHLGFERTSGEDVAFGLRQITDVALKAMSPGINDPTTAVHALGHASALLCSLVRLPAISSVVRDEAGVPRVIWRALDVPALLELALSQLRHYGSSDAEVAARMLQLLREVAYVNPRQDLVESIRNQIDRTLRAVRRQSFDPEEVARLEAVGAAATAALNHAWAPAEDAGRVLSEAHIQESPRTET